MSSGVEGDQDQKLRVYDIPFISPWLRRCGAYHFSHEMTLFADKVGQNTFHVFPSIKKNEKIDRHHFSFISLDTQNMLLYYNVHKYINPIIDGRLFLIISKSHSL